MKFQLSHSDLCWRAACRKFAYAHEQRRNGDVYEIEENGSVMYGNGNDSILGRMWKL